MLKLKFPAYNFTPSSPAGRRGSVVCRTAITAVIEPLEVRQLFTTYYADASASAGGVGTQGSPWNSLSAITAYTSFSPGDVVQLSGAFSNQVLTLGSSATGITLTSADPQNPASISESSTYSFYDAIEVTTSGVKISYLNLTGPGLTTSSNSFAGIDFENAGGTQLTGATVDHVTATGFVFAGLNFEGHTSGFTNVTVTNSTFNDNQVSGLAVTGTDVRINNGTGVLRPELFNNVTITNVTASGNAGSAIYFNANHLGPSQNSNNGGIYVSSVNGAVISHCTAIGNCYNSYGSCAIWVHTCNNVDIEYCEAADTRTQRSGFDGNGFDFDHDTSNSVMQFDYSHGNDGIGLYICSFTGASDCSNDTIRYNISDDDGRNSNYGCRIYAGPNFFVTNANIYDNTILATGSSEIGFGVDGNSNGATGCTVNFINNVIYAANDSEAVKFPTYTPSLTNIKLEGNDYWATGNGSNTFNLIWGGTTYQSFNTFVSATGEETINDRTVGQNVDPLLNNETVSDLPISNVSNLGLSSQSSLQDAGLILTAPPFSNSAPYSNNAPYNLAGSAWNGIGTQDYFGGVLAASSANDLGAGSASGPLILTGSSGSTSFTINKSTSSTNSLIVNGTVYNQVTGVIINGATGNQTVIADFTDGSFTLTFNGGTGPNTLVTRNIDAAATPSIIFNPDGSANNLNIGSGTVTVPAGTQTGIRQAIFSNITIASDAELKLAQPASRSSRTLVALNGSMILNGILDLGGNDLDVKNGNLAFINDQVRIGLSGVTEDAIVSSSGLSNVALAVTANTVDGTATGSVLYSSFDSAVAAASDVLIKSTYNGDVNLDGTIDSTDYSRVDSGFTNRLTGWFNGDFNYDGVINGSDYAMIDNAFNSHGASLAGEIADEAESAVPVAAKAAFVPSLFLQNESVDPLVWLPKHRVTAMESIERLT